MKNKSAGFYGSSLEMLLDTMCSMLGGVVFIALTVALFTQYSAASSPAHSRDQAAALSNELAQVMASNNAVSLQLQAALRRLQDPQHRPQTNVMRLPNISSTTRERWPVIVRYGKIYPLEVFSPTRRGKLAMNDRTLQYRQEQSGTIAVPRQGVGDEPEGGVTQMVRAFRANAKTNFYFVFWVYEDSFDAFIRARETAARLGFQYGWEPLAQDTPLRVSTQGGSGPLPQN